jgi:hypothetical protein
MSLSKAFLHSAYAPLVIAGSIVVLTITGIIVTRNISDSKKPQTSSASDKSQTPTPTEQASPSATIVPSPTSRPIEPLTIDCVGPDGKHLRVTQKVCNEFNKAWLPSPTPTSIPKQQNNTGNTNSGGNSGGSSHCDVQGAICSPSSSTQYGTQSTTITFP